MTKWIRKVPPNYMPPTILEVYEDTNNGARKGAYKYYPNASAIRNAFGDKCLSDYVSLIDVCYDEVAKDWMDKYQDWLNSGGDVKEKDCYHYYWEKDEPPSRAYYRPYSNEEAVWYQLYDNVFALSGVPVSPAFETREELINYLVKNGDFDDQKRNKNNYSDKDKTHAFVMSHIFYEGK